jgi:hypothetical protein
MTSTGEGGNCVIKGMWQGNAPQRPPPPPPPPSSLLSPKPHQELTRHRAHRHSHGGARTPAAGRGAGGRAGCTGGPAAAAVQEEGQLRDSRREEVGRTSGRGVEGVLLPLGPRRRTAVAAAAALAVAQEEEGGRVGSHRPSGDPQAAAAGARSRGAGAWRGAAAAAHTRSEVPAAEGPGAAAAAAAAAAVGAGSQGTAPCPWAQGPRRPHPGGRGHGRPSPSHAHPPHQGGSGSWAAAPGWAGAGGRTRPPSSHTRAAGQGGQRAAAAGTAPGSRHPWEPQGQGPRPQAAASRPARGQCPHPSWSASSTWAAGAGGH